MSVLEEGVVVKTGGNIAFVEIKKSAKCDGCRACSFFGANKIRLRARKETECAIGDRVVVEMPQKSVWGVHFILFPFPLLFIFLAILITEKAEWYIQVPVILFSLVLSVVYVAVCEYFFRKKSEYLPAIKSVIENNSQLGVTRND